MKTKIFICYSTNRDDHFQRKFAKEIKKSIGCSFDIQCVYNTGSRSLARIYNSAWQALPYDDSYVFVFMHHDIRFKSEGWGKTLLNLFNSQPDASIIGVAGTDTLYEHGAWWLDNNGALNQNNLWGKVWHNNGKKKWKSDFTSVNKKCEKLQPVVTVDGLFIAFDPDKCEEFDDDLFTGFHFYDTSFCIKNHLAGNKIYVTEKIPICHESVGNVSPQWEEFRQKFVERYTGKFSINNELVQIKGVEKL